MLSASALATLVAVWLLGAATPGPDLLLVLSRSLIARRTGLAAAAGAVTGVGLWLAGSLAGLAALLQAVPNVLAWMELAGGLFLLFMGVTGLRSAWPVWRRGGRGLGDSGKLASTSNHTDLRSTYFLGLATNLSNPKALVFFGALLAPFITPRGGGSLSPAVTVGLYVLLMALAAGFFALVAVVAGAPALNRRVRGAIPAINVVAAALFVLIGLGVAGAAIRTLTGSG